MAADSQAAFAMALLQPGALPPPGLRATPRRFAVYRNNVVTSLVAALEIRFAVSATVVGEAFFRTMAGQFVLAHPPRSPVLQAYGEELPTFVETFQPAAGVPYLADLMRLEIACSDAFHAPDAAAATAADLAAVAPSAFAQMRLVAHPAARLLASPHPVATILAMHAPGHEPAPVEQWAGEDVLLTRPALTVAVRVLPPGGLPFAAALFRGCTLEHAAATAAAITPAFDLAANLAGLVAAGAVLSFIPGEKP